MHQSEIDELIEEEERIIDAKIEAEAKVENNGCGPASCFIIMAIMLGLLLILGC